MLPDQAALFTLARDLASGKRVTRIAAPKWYLQRHGIAALAGSSGAQECREDLARSALAWAVIEREARPVIEQFRSAGIRVAALKGLSYATTLYALPAERPMNDIDLLVPSFEEPGARTVLEQARFKCIADDIDHHASTWVRGEFVVDLHRDIIGRRRSRIDLQQVWARTIDGAWPGLSRLEATDELVFHLVHLIRDRFRSPLIHVIDTAKLLQRTTNERVLERSAAWSLGFPVALALRFCRNVVDGDVERPAGWLGPRGDEIAELTEWGRPRKLLFDIATAGSLRQVAGRLASYRDRS